MGVGVGDEFLVRDRVPRVQHRQLGEQPHGAPVGTHGAVRRRAAGVLVGAGLPAREDQGGGEPLEVPLPGAVHRLVEVVQVDDQVTAGVAVQPEVRRVGVTADLGADPGHRGAGEVVRHEARRAAQEGERCGRHPPHPQRGQLGDAAPARLLDRLHRAGTGDVGVQRGMGGTRDALPQCLALLLGRALHGPLREATHQGPPRPGRGAGRLTGPRPGRRLHTGLGHRDRLPRDSQEHQLVPTVQPPAETRQTLWTTPPLWKNSVEKARPGLSPACPPPGSRSTRSRRTTSSSHPSTWRTRA